MLYLERINNAILHLKELLYTKFFLVLFIVTITGLFTGRISGEYIVNKTLKGEITFLTFIFSPSQNLIDIYSLLNDSNDYKRLAGYYAYKDSGYVDTDFLYERYKIEESVIIKKVIIWIAECNIRSEKLVDFYTKLYNISPESIKKQLSVKMKK